MRYLAPVLFTLALLAPSSAAAEEPASTPSSSSNSGLGLVVAGGLATGIGGLTLATTPLCRLSAIRSSAQPACIATSLAVGGVLAAVGVPLLVLGVRKRASSVPAVSVAPTTGGAVFVWTGKF